MESVMRINRHIVSCITVFHYRCADNQAMRKDPCANSRGFSLIEALMAILILTVGFMFVGRIMVSSIGSSTLSRSKSTAGIAATNKLEALALKYRANSSDTDLTVGNHGPEQLEILNPNDSNAVNRYNVSWTVSAVSTLKAVQVTVTVTPIGSGTTAQNQVGLNKVLNVSTIFGFKSPMVSTGSGTTL
jgi:prepilin-type N-terminal cleavage/methylation domain-containing protein